MQVVLSLIIFLLGLNLYAAVPMDELQAIDINGTKQWIFQYAHDRSKPVVLFIHGGPGSPLMPYSRAWDDAFAKEFVVVHWDQRGAGKSYDPLVSPSTYNLEQVVSDGIQVVDFLREKFNQQKIILVGHSWGSIVGAHLATASPELFRAYISVGTATNMKASEALRYSLLREKVLTSGRVEAIQRLEALGSPPFLTVEKFEEFGLLWLEFMGWQHTSYRHSVNDFIAAIGNSKEYSPTDLENAAVGTKVWVEAYGPTLASYDASRSILALQVPVFFAQGRFDLNTPTSLAMNYFQLLNAPNGKKWVDFEKSAHFPMYDEPERFLDLLKEAATR